jgi:anti-anti-sigma factor
VLIDATIIRAVLLPASMKLLGDWNWYLPKWLEWLPEVAHEPAPTEPVAEQPTPAPDEDFGMEIERRGTNVRVALRGELDYANAHALGERLAELEAEGPELLAIDLRRLGFMDSTGLREIAAAVRRGRQEGRRVVLVKGSAPVDGMLAITRADAALETVEDPAAVGFADNWGSSAPWGRVGRSLGRIESDLQSDLQEAEGAVT